MKIRVAIRQMQMVINKSSKLAMMLSLVLFGSVNAVAQTSTSANPGSTTSKAAVFAKVGDVEITQEEYNAAFYTASRSQFYHGKPPEAVIAGLQREVEDKLVTRVLLLQEAKRRGLRPDEAELKKSLDSYEQRYARSEQWKKNREQVLPGLTARLEQDNLLAQLEQKVRGTPAPNEDQVRTYYLAHPEKFTEPEQIRVSVIMLKVDPSSPKTEWEKADEKAKKILKKLQDGADFAALARVESGDPSAQQGGDMGYLHNGMLPEGAQQVLNKLKVGELSPPVPLLEGIAVFRLTDRKISTLNSFEKVRVRAQELLQRDMGKEAWNGLIDSLKKETPIHIDQSNYLPLPTPTPNQIKPN
jgi:parvulin-like peptidyl-prolyl isomerase